MNDIWQWFIDILIAWFSSYYWVIIHCDLNCCCEKDKWIWSSNLNPKNSDVRDCSGKIFTSFILLILIWWLCKLLPEMKGSYNVSYDAPEIKLNKNMSSKLKTMYSKISIFSKTISIFLAWFPVIQLAPWVERRFYSTSCKKSGRLFLKMYWSQKMLTLRDDD